MTKILFVCLGNICRSPLAKAVFIQKVKRAGLEDKIFADSAGTSGFHEGDMADPRTIQIAKINNTPFEHTARQVSVDDFHKFDLILAMDESNLANLLRLRPENSGAQVHLMRSWDDNKTGIEVPDPYYSTGLVEFQRVYDILNHSCGKFLEHLKEAAAENATDSQFNVEEKIK